MRRDLIVTALVFAVIGFLGGYFYTRRAAEQRAVVAPAAGPTTEEAMGLPPGHPPMDVSQQIVTLRQEAEKNPRDPAASFRLGEFLFDAGRCADAIPWYERGLKLEPKNTDARVVLAGCLADTGQADEGVKHLNTVLELKPNEPHALYHLAVILLRAKQDRAGAERIYRQLRLNHPTFQGLGELERLLRESGQSRGGPAGTGGR